MTFSVNKEDIIYTLILIRGLELFNEDSLYLIMLIFTEIGTSNKQHKCKFDLNSQF